MAANVREPELPPTAELAINISLAALSGTQGLEEFIHAADQKDRAKRLYSIQFEFLCFLMHVTSRVALGELGHDRRCKMQVQLAPLIVPPTIESAFGDVPPKKKDEIEKDFYEKLYYAELEYGECEQLFGPNDPFASNTVFSRFVAKVCKLVGEEYGPVVISAVRLRTIESFLELNLPETVRALGKEL